MTSSTDNLLTIAHKLNAEGKAVKLTVLPTRTKRYRATQWVPKTRGKGVVKI